MKDDKRKLTDIEKDFLIDTYKMAINNLQNLTNEEKMEMLKSGKLDKLLNELDKLKSRIWLKNNYEFE